MECPICQRRMTIPDGGVNAIPQNLRLGFEVEVASYMSKIDSGSEKSCDACIDGGKGPAVVFCCTCGHFLCTLCHEHHKSSKIFHHHLMVGLDQESVRLLPSIMTPTEQNRHEKKIYCETCQCLVCRDSTLSLHNHHRITEVCNIAHTHRDRMREALGCAHEMASKLTNAIGAKDKMVEQVETSRENVTLLIIQACEQLHQAIEERKMKLLSELGAISLSKITALSLQKEQLVKIQDEIGRYTEMTSHILQTHTDHEVVALGDLLPTELKATLKKVEGVSLSASDIHVTLKSDSLMKELCIFGHVMAPSQSTWSSRSTARVDKVYSIQVETKSSEGVRYPYGGLQVKAELRSRSHDGAVVPGKVEDHGDGTYTITLTPQTVGPHQLLITMDGEHVQGSPHDLDVRASYRTLCNPQQVISCSGRPSGIAIHDSGDIYVACNDDSSIRVFDQGGHEKRIIGSGGRGDGQFRSLLVISIKGDVMYVADDGNDRIQKLTTGGQFLQKFGQRGSRQGRFNEPISVTVDQRDRMIVADINNNRVVVLDQNGSWLLTINGNISGFENPWEIALDPQGNIHVYSWDPSTIKVFTHEGSYIRSYGDIINGPCRIAIDEDGYSFVSEETGNCLSIFDPQGNKIHTVDNLDIPGGVALDPISGSLYIASPCTNTILKYSL